MRSLLRFRPLFTGLVALAVVLGSAARGRAELHGGIEIGARGVKAVVLDITPGADGAEVKVVMTGTENTTLVAGLEKSGRFDPEALKATVAAVAKFADVMQKERGVPAAHVHVVGSSGLFSVPKGKPDLLKENHDTLAAAVRDACGLKLDFIDMNREAALSFGGTVPAKHVDGAALMDIGSGNTKGGCREDGKLVTAGIPFGTRTFADLVKSRAGGKPFAEAAAVMRDEVLVPSLRKQLSSAPAVAKRERLYLSGGSAWAFATLVRPGDRDNFVALTADDLEAYRKLLAGSPGAHPTPDLAGIADAAARKEAENEVKAVQKVFTPEDLVSGAELLTALASELGFKDKKVYFARQAQHAWIVGYVAEKSGMR